MCFYENSSVTEFYSGKSIFITGGTGFVGKIIIEKLLRACPGICKIYVLTRAIKGIRPEERLAKLLNEPLFQHVLPEALNKVVAIAGDIAIPGLGIISSDLEVLRKTVSVVFHCAATVKFTEPLDVAMNLNVEGTRRVLDLAINIENLTAVVHVSTAFSNCDQEFIEEKVYFPSNRELMNFHPNTYTYSKQLAEQLVDQYKTLLPICVVRPSIVISTYKEPIPGFVDNLNGMSGVLAAIMTGIMHIEVLNDEMRLDTVPADYVANLIIVAGYACANSARTTKGLPVYNFSSCNNPFIFSNILDILMESVYRYPVHRMVAFPWFYITSNKRLFFVLNLLLHKFPAFVLESFATMLHRKDRLILLYRKVNESTDVTQFFCVNKWNFSMDTTKILHESLSPADQELFNFDLHDIKWEDHMRDYIHGLSKYAFKNNDISAGKDRLKRMRWIHTSLNLLGLLSMAAVILTAITFIQ